MATAGTRTILINTQYRLVEGVARIAEPLSNLLSLSFDKTKKTRKIHSLAERSRPTVASAASVVGPFVVAAADAAVVVVVAAGSGSVAVVVGSAGAPAASVATSRPSESRPPGG